MEASWLKRFAFYVYNTQINTITDMKSFYFNILYIHISCKKMPHCHSNNKKVWSLPVLVKSQLTRPVFLHLCVTPLDVLRRPQHNFQPVCGEQSRYFKIKQYSHGIETETKKKMWSCNIFHGLKAALNKLFWETI